MKTNHHTILAQEQQAQLKRIQEMTDDQIDLSDMPERKDWSGEERGKFHRSVQAGTLHILTEAIVAR